MQTYEYDINMLLSLIRVALHQDIEPTIAWDDNCDEEALEAMIIRQSLVTMLYPVIMLQKGETWEAIQTYLRPVYDKEIHCGMIQEYEIQALLDDMEKDGFDCMPLKGWVMRKYYPDPIMRSFCDLDLLVKDLDSEKMQKWMEERGYIQDTKEETDNYRKPPYMYVELHYDLLSEENLKQRHSDWKEKDLMSLWKKEYLFENQKHVYQLSDEDFLIHHLLHLYKHFTHFGAGIRALVDLYLFMNHKGNKLNQRYLQKQLKLLGIENFCEKMMALAIVCAEGKETNEDDKLLLEYLTETGIYGDWTRHKISRLMQTDNHQSFNSKKQQNFFYWCFLPLAIMKDRYPRLQKMPCLLPLYWIMRIVRVLFFEKYKLNIFQNNQMQSSYDRMQKIYLAAGVTREDLK